MSLNRTTVIPSVLSARSLSQSRGSISGFGVRNPRLAPTNPESQIPNPDTDGVKIFIYDNYPGGIGFSVPLYDMHDELIAKTRQLITQCECENGCPGCVGPIGNTGPMAKAVALRILDLITTEYADRIATTEYTDRMASVHSADDEVPF